MNNSIVVTAPSNIALIKYWGKADTAEQWPASDSLSMTLSHCSTKTTASTSHHDSFQFNGEVLENTDPRARKPLEHVAFLKRELGYLGGIHVSTSNSFPDGCGIASSASGFAALSLSVTALCLGCSSFEELNEKGYDIEKISHLARMGSGSAGRSIFGGFVLWQKKDRPIDQRITCEFAADWWELADTVVICNRDQKSVSSSKAHKAAFSSPLFSARLAGINEKMKRARTAIEKRDLWELGPLIEEEALEMHSVIMTASEPVQYLDERSFQVICWLRKWRQENAAAAFFTIDAGPNIHIISHKRHQATLKEALYTRFPDLGVILDKVGSGARFIDAT